MQLLGWKQNDAFRLWFDEGYATANVLSLQQKKKGKIIIGFEKIEIWNLIKKEEIRWEVAEV